MDHGIGGFKLSIQEFDLVLDTMFSNAIKSLIGISFCSSTPGNETETRTSL